MRITCPNCTAHFEIPSELLGRKGRSLKCANCGHSWYQTPQVETIDLAEIMGEEYAARARAEMGASRPPGAASAPGAQGQRPNLPGQPPQGQPGRAMPPQMPARPQPPGATSMMRRAPPVPPQAPPPQYSYNMPQQRNAPGPNQAMMPPAGAPAWFQPQGGAPGMPGGPPPGAAWGQQRPGAPAGQQMPPGAQPGAWGQQQPMPGPPGMPPGAAAWYQQQPPPGAAGAPPGAASWYQQQMPPGRAPPGAPPGWYRPDQGPGYQQQPGMGPQAAPLPGQSVMGQGGPAGPVVGGGAVSWIQQPGAFVAPPGPAQGFPQPQHGPVASPMPGQSIMGQAGARPVGEGAVSWMQHPGQQLPPGASAVSQMGRQVAAPGQAAVSILDGSVHAPGQAAVSLLDGSIEAPGEAARSLLDGSIHAPGDVARSLLDGSVQAAQPGQSMLHEAGGGAPGTSMRQEPNLGGPPADLMRVEPSAAATAEAAPAGDAATDAETAGEDKPAPLWSGAAEDEELVDPNADRPNFGTAAAEAAQAEEAAADEEADADEAEDEDAAAVPFVRKKSLDPAYVTAGLMVFALIAVGLVLWSQRGPLSRMWPGFAALYNKMGMAPKPAGEGLRLAQSGMRLQRIGGVETLVVKGYISNIGEGPRSVPGLRLQLIDATNQVVQEVKGSAPKSSLEAGASVDYELRLELPDMAKAKSVIVSWDG